MADTVRETASSGRALVVHGRVRDVDPRRWVVDVELENGSFYEDLPLVSPYFHQENGEGIFALPEVGAHCLVLQSAVDGNRPAVLGFLPVYTSDEGDYEESTDHSAGRGPATPGDILLHGRDGNFLRLRRGGLVEMGASEGARTQIYPIGDLIRQICANYELFVSGSYVKVNTLDSAEIDEDEGPTPILVDVNIQEYTEKPPIISLQLGHIVDDESRNLAGAPDQRIVGRLLVHRQEAVERAELAGIPPSPDQAVCAIRFDREGNYEHILSGQYLVKAVGRRLYITDNDIQFVRGGRTVRITGNLDQSVGGDYVESVDGNRTIQSRGVLTLSCERLELEERTSRQNSLAGNNEFEVGGNEIHRVAGDSRRTTGGSLGESVVGDTVETTGGKHVHTVLHAAQPTSMLQDAVAHLLNVVDGRIRTAALAGSIEFIVGPAASPICKIRMQNDPTKPMEIGRVSIEWANPLQRLIIDALGAVHYQNSLGEWVLDSVGRTYLGMRNSPGGNVVTTLTHPVCYLTGAPIMGCSYVSAGGGPPAPLVSAPVIRPLGNVPDVDIPRP